MTSKNDREGEQSGQSGQSGQEQTEQETQRKKCCPTCGGHLDDDLGHCEDCVDARETLLSKVASLEQQVAEMTTALTEANGEPSPSPLEGVRLLELNLNAEHSRAMAAESQLAEMTQERDAERDDNIKQQARLRVGWDKAYDRWKVTKAAHLAAEAEALKQRERADASALALSQIREGLRWALDSLDMFVGRDEGHGAFIKGNGAELVGFGAKRNALEDLLSSPALPPLSPATS